MEPGPGGLPIQFDPIIVHQVPFCPPFWSTVSNFSGPSLWKQLPNECRTANVAAAVLTCFISIGCILIHAATIVAYSSMRGDILKRKRRSSERRIEKRRKADLSVLKEAADYAFAMTTQGRLRMAFAISGLLSGGLLLPITGASAGVAYSQPFPHSVLNPEKSWSELRGYSTVITTLFHLTLTASLCTLLLMVVERFRETLRICPDRYIKSAKEKSGTSYPRESYDFDRSSVSNSFSKRANDWKKNPDAVARKQNAKVGRLEDTFIYAFRQSYTFIDLVMTLIVPAVSGIVTTLAQAVFGAEFEPFGLVVTGAYRPERMESINGLISHKIASYPHSIYVYSATVGVLIVAGLVVNFLSFLRCHTLMSIARYLPGYQHSRDLFKFSEGIKGGPRRRPRNIPKIAPDSVRLSRRAKWSNKNSRQDPDGLSIDDPDFYESSISSFPLPPPPATARYSVMSVDTISLPPPPRPESVFEVPEQQPMFTFPSLPSVARYDDVIEEDDGPDEDVTAIKAEAFFWNIRQSKVVLASFLLFLLLSAPLLILFAAGIFYPHDGTLVTIMGGPVDITNSSTKTADAAERGVNNVESSVFIEPTPPDDNLYKESTTKEDYETKLKEIIQTANHKNWVTTLSAVFLILYTVATISPFVAYCVASRKFRCEISRFFCFCIFFQWYRYGKRVRKRAEAEIVRSRSNRSVLNASKPSYNRSMPNINEPRFVRTPLNIPRDLRYSMKAPNTNHLLHPIRREKTISGTRNVSWEIPDRYGISKM